MPMEGCHATFCPMKYMIYFPFTFSGTITPALTCCEPHGVGSKTTPFLVPVNEILRGGQALARITVAPVTPVGQVIDPVETNHARVFASVVIVRAIRDQHWVASIGNKLPAIVAEGKLTPRPEGSAAIAAVDHGQPVTHLDHRGVEDQAVTQRFVGGHDRLGVPHHAVRLLLLKLGDVLRDCRATQQRKTKQQFRHFNIPV